MRKFQIIKRTIQLVSLILITTLLISTNYVKAEEKADINPDLGFGYVLLFGGESATIFSSTTAPFDVHIIAVASIGNSTLSATITDITSTASGLWWVALTGNGPRSLYDFSQGFSFGTVPDSGEGATININEIFCIGFVVGGLVLDPETVSTESPIKYSIQIN